MEYKSIVDKIVEAYNRIHGKVHHTALFKSYFLSDWVNGDVYLKCENEQFTGSFKARGSLNKILSLSEEEKSRGLITASTGNHALGFARSLQMSNAMGKVYLPEHASPSKLKALSYFPVEIIKYGTDSLVTELYAKKCASEEGMTWVSPYNDIEVLSGQGTIGVEISQELENVDYLLANVGGGGLISGVGSYMKAAYDNLEVIACQPLNSPEMTMSLKEGRIVDYPEAQETLSDGSAGGIEKDAITFNICQQIVDDSILVDEDEIKKGIKTIFTHHKKVIEGAAGVAVAAIMKNKERFKNKTSVIILCGSNIDSQVFAEIIG